jgi:hypothetical protein
VAYCGIRDSGGDNPLIIEEWVEGEISASLGSVRKLFINSEANYTDMVSVRDEPQVRM